MNYDVFGTPHVNPAAFCTIKQLITEVLGDLCKSLQNNATFQKVYRKKLQQPGPRKPAQTTERKSVMQRQNLQGQTQRRPPERKRGEQK
jgi:hypothetical protein